MKELSDKIISKLPYSKSFLFVDEISFVDDSKIIGHYTFKEDSFFHNAHFSHIPITPGVIIIEMVGQIGMVGHFIYLNKLYDKDTIFHPLLSNIEVSFLKEIKTNDLLTIISKKIYFRNGILKSVAQVFDSENELCCMAKAQLKMVIDNE